MTKLSYFMHARALRLLKDSAVTLFVITNPEKGEVTPFNVGTTLKPPMHIVIDDEKLECTMSFGGKPQRVSIGWSAVLRVDPLNPPKRPGTPAPALANAA